MDGPLKGYLWSTRSNYDYILGTYENPVILEECRKWFKADTVFYDLGANIGFYALLANRFITTGKIYSFEPVSFVRDQFEKHLELNKNLIGADNIRLMPFAISDGEKEISFSADKDQTEGNTYILSSPFFKTGKKTTLVKSYSIDELIQQGYDKPDIIKIDVEGAEYDVLKGAAETISQFTPHIILATHDCHLPGVKDNCIRCLEGMGYILKDMGNYNIHFPGLDNFIAVHKSRI